MNPFQYANPAKLEDAIALLADQPDESEVLAGGTDLVSCLKQNLVAPKRVVSLKAVTGLKGIDVGPDEVRIGAATTLAELSEHEAIRKLFPSLVHAIDQIGSPQIISAATLGGDLCQRPRCWYFRQGFGLLGQHEGKSLIPEGDNRYHAVFGNEGPAYFVCPSSLAPVLVALRATMTLAGPGGRTRRLKVGEFFRTPKTARERENVLEPNEIVSFIHIPLAGLANAVYEVRARAQFDWPLVIAAVAFQRGDTVQGAEVVLGQVASIPWHAVKSESVLNGKKLDPAMAAKAGEAAAAGATPLSQNAYKVQLVKVAVKRALLAAAGLREG